MRMRAHPSLITNEWSVRRIGDASSVRPTRTMLAAAGRGERGAMRQRWARRPVRAHLLHPTQRPRRVRWEDEADTISSRDGGSAKSVGMAAGSGADANRPVSGDGGSRRHCGTEVASGDRSHLAGPWQKVLGRGRAPTIHLRTRRFPRIAPASDPTRHSGLRIPGQLSSGSHARTSNIAQTRSVA